VDAGELIEQGRDELVVGGLDGGIGGTGEREGLLVERADGDGVSSRGVHSLRRLRRGCRTACRRTSRADAVAAAGQLAGAVERHDGLAGAGAAGDLDRAAGIERHQRALRRMEERDPAIERLAQDRGQIARVGDRDERRRRGGRGRERCGGRDRARRGDQLSGREPEQPIGDVVGQVAGDVEELVVVGDLAQRRQPVGGTPSDSRYASSCAASSGAGAAAAPTGTGGAAGTSTTSTICSSPVTGWRLPWRRLAQR
jgi:hypothetical protein